MGCALFSQSYSATPAVREQPEQIPCEKWSSWNNFDPDSDEFFIDAQYEAFIDPIPYSDSVTSPVIIQRIDSPVGGLSPRSESASSSGSDTSSPTDRGSPMAVGSDDPAMLMADVYSSLDFEQRFFLSGPPSATDWTRTRGDVQARLPPFSPSANPPRLTPLFNPRAPSISPTANHTTPAASDSSRRPARPRPRSATLSTPTTSTTLPLLTTPSTLRTSTTATEIQRSREEAYRDRALMAQYQLDQLRQEQRQRRLASATDQPLTNTTVFPSSQWSVNWNSPSVAAPSADATDSTTSSTNTRMPMGRISVPFVRIQNTVI